MKNQIDIALNKNKKLKLMTHIVAGYPDLDTNLKIINTMVESGTDIIEIQIPFSDPMADGPTIMKANQCALDNKTTLNDFFELVAKLRKAVTIPLLAMTYCNIPFSCGVEKFMEKCSLAGLNGVIIPDLPFDEENEDYISIAGKFNLHAIQVISPKMEVGRLKKMLTSSEGFIYTTLKVGITGARESLKESGLEFLDVLRSNTKIPIAAGFGISSPEHIKMLKSKCDIAVVGSHIINVYDNYGLQGIKEFILDCKSIANN